MNCIPLDKCYFLGLLTCMYVNEHLYSKRGIEFGVCSKKIFLLARFGKKCSKFALEKLLVLARVLLGIFERSKSFCSNSLGSKIESQKSCSKLARLENPQARFARTRKFFARSQHYMYHTICKVLLQSLHILQVSLAKDIPK